jgi:drug/metabolite transporter (DMT)-like permease
MNYGSVRNGFVSPQEFSLLLLALTASVAGQFFLKAGALKLGRVNPENALSHVLSIAVTPELLGGLIIYGLGAILYILLLTRVNLSVLAPALALSYVFSVLIGYFVFREPIPMIRLLGIGFVVAGVILVVWKK